MKCHQSNPGHRQAFSRWDLLVATSTLLLLFCLAFPLLAHSRNRSELVVCLGNLERIGAAYQGWSDENGRDDRPWWVSLADGGSMPEVGTRIKDVWIEYANLAQFLSNPGYLKCPSDRNKIAARTWKIDANGGFFNSTYRDNSISYFIGLHAVFDNPCSILGGDRHFGVSQANVPCEVKTTDAFGLLPNDPNVKWTNAIHGIIGNLLFNNGEVRTVSRAGLQEAIKEDTQGKTGVVHTLMP
jgi:hypothetical protein